MHLALTGSRSSETAEANIHQHSSTQPSTTDHRNGLSKTTSAYPVAAKIPRLSSPNTEQTELPRHTKTATQHPAEENLFVSIDASKLQFHLLNVPGDGDCFFHCLSLVLVGDSSETRNYRYTVCKYIYENWSEWKERAEAGHEIESVPDKDTYWAYMATSKQYATVCEVQASCELFNCSITVWLKARMCTNKERQTYSDKYIRTSFSGNNIDKHLDVVLSGNHFQVMLFDESPPIHDTSDIGTGPDASQQHDMVSEQKKSKKRRNVYTNAEASLQEQCKSVNVSYIAPDANETQHKQTCRRQTIRRNLKKATENPHRNESNEPNAPDLQHILNVVKRFEDEQMSYSLSTCKICHERRLDSKLKAGVCNRCTIDKNSVKMFSNENRMDPGVVPPELDGLTVVEQQLICKIAPAIQLHMLKHGGVAAKGHCVTFAQAINQPAQIFPRLPQEIDIIKMRRRGRNDTSKDFKVRRYKVQNALLWLQENNPVFKDIIISDERLSQLPRDGELRDGHIFEYDDDGHERINDNGPAFEQINPGDEEICTDSSVLLPDPPVDIRHEVEHAVRSVVGPDSEVSCNRRNVVTIPWPTRDNNPLSENTTNHFFTMAIPTLFPYGAGDFRMNRPRTCTSMSDWAKHLIWYKDGRFAQHQYFKFITHNIIVRKITLERTKFIVNQKLGDKHLTVADLQEMLNRNDDSITKKILYFSASLRGSPQYWAQRSKELTSLIQFNIYQGQGLPSMFTTGSCAEYYFKPLRKLLDSYVESANGKTIETKGDLYEAIQRNSHLVTHYFDLRTRSYFKHIMANIFGIKSYWYRYEFTPSRGMIHWHGMGWREDRQPHQLLYDCLQNNMNDRDMARELSMWAESVFGMTASHPAGVDAFGQPRTDMWPAPEGTAPPIPEEKNPLVKLLCEAATTQGELLNDHILMTNKVNIHACSDFCWKKNRRGDKICRMEFGTEKSPGKSLRQEPAIVRDKNGSRRLEMKRDHPRLVQHSSIHTQAWRANGDVSLILSKSNPLAPSIQDIMPVERYVSGYACKGSQGTGAICDIFKDLACSADTHSSVQTLCTKLLMKTMKRDVSGVEVCHELSTLPLYRCSHQFQYVSLGGSRVLEKTGSTATKMTPLDKYLERDKADKTSWYTFLCKSGRVPVIHGQTHATFPITTEYARTMLLLHWPNWRQTKDIIGEEEWLTSFKEFLLTDACPNFVNADVEKAKQKSSQNENNDDDDEQAEVHDVENQPEWLELMQPDAIFDDFSTDFKYDDGGPDFDWSGDDVYPPNAKEYFEQLCEDSVEDDAIKLPDVNLTAMNAEQRFAYNLVMQNIIDHSAGKDASLRLVVAGEAGSGKSYLINCLVYSIRKFCENNKAVQVLAPTGNSANLICSGKTIHSFLKVPCGPKSKKDMTAPVGTTAEKLQKNCEGLVCLLVDERSLVGCNLLGWMEYHCQCGMKTDKPWGDLPVVVFLGDDIQLPPVCDSPVYRCNSSKPASMRGALLWQSFNTVVTLTKIIRQNNEEQHFKNVLQSLRTYRTTQEDTDWLQKFQWDNLQQRYSPSAMQNMAKNALFAFPTHAEEWEHNKAQLLLANRDFPIAKITAECQGIHAKTSSADTAGGLIRTLYVCKSARVHLTTNINVKFGLFNGAVGNVMDIICSRGKSPQDGFPNFIIVEFPKFKGPPFMEDHPTWIPVPAVDRRLDCQCCKRRQVPLRPGFGTTIHRLQGTIHYH